MADDRFGWCRVDDANDVSIFYTDDGPLDAQPLLLVHGWTCDSHDWSFQLEDFAAAHRVIAVDLRGHGRSSCPADGYDPRTFAADLAVLLGHLDVAPVVAVGHSLGGLVVAALAVLEPDRVRATVAVDPAYGVAEARAARLPELLARLGTPAGNAHLAVVLAGAEPTAPAWMRAWHRRRVLGSPPAVVRDVMHGMYFAADQLGRRRQTDAFLLGRRSPVLAMHRSPEMASWEASTSAHPATRVMSWSDVGHWIQQERAADFNQAVLEWVERLPT